MICFIEILSDNAIIKLLKAEVLTMGDFTNNSQNSDLEPDMNSNNEDMNINQDNSFSEAAATPTEENNTADDLNIQSNSDTSLGKENNSSESSSLDDTIEPVDTYADNQASGKVVDGFDEATRDIEQEVRDSVVPDLGKEKSWGKIVGAAVVVVLLLLGGVKMCTGGTPAEFDDSMILVMNQTQVTPEKITVYMKTIYGVDAPVIRVSGVLKEEFSATSIDDKNNVVTWFWTVEGKRSQKAFNKTASIKIKKGKDKYYEEEFVLDKEIRIDYQK